MENLLLLVSKKSYRAHDFLEAAQKIGVRVIVGSNHRQVLADLVPGNTLFLDFHHPEKSVREIVAFSRINPISTIVAAEDDGALLAAQASEALGLVSNSVESVRATRNKYLLRRILTESKILQPSFHLLSTKEDPALQVEKISLPCVIKPLFLSASRGVMRADTPEELSERCRRLRRILEDPEVKAEGGDLAEKILVESYIPGVEAAFEGILDRGELKTLALFDKPDPLEGPFFEETIYVTPSRRPPSLQKEIEKTVSLAAQALGLRTGPVHAELRLNDDGAWLIEMAARSIGGLCSRTLRFGTGMTLEEIILRQAIGDYKSLEREPQAVGVMMIPIPRAGILRGVEGKERAEQVPGIVEIDITIPVGQTLVPLPEGSRYLGFIFARGKTPQEVESALREAHRRLRFELE
jgi:phosphoribosylaminoimidazole carboxylase (NCAIR synthetase)